MRQPSTGAGSLRGSRAERATRGLMMDWPLTLGAIFRRGETLFATCEIVTRLPDKSLYRYSYAAFADRARRLARVLQDLGIERADRVGTLLWNQHQHLEAYFAVPLVGGILHTLNLRLSDDSLAYIIRHADDRALIVDASLLAVLERVRRLVDIPQVIVVGDGVWPDAMEYESTVARTSPADELPEGTEDEAAALCYTTGTTGQPKGVLYSHRSLVLHSLNLALPDALGISEGDTIAPVVPMFHVNAWGIPFAAVMLGSKLVLPGPHLDGVSLADLCARERVTLVAGVPTIWMGLLQLLDANPGAYDLSSISRMIIGGSAVPQAMIEAFEQRHGLKVVHAWGMTEMSPVGTVSYVPSAMQDAPQAAQYRQRAKQGRPLPLVEIRSRNAEGLTPWDGTTMGELEVRGPSVASAYFRHEGADDQFTEDGWFRTGDIVTIDDLGAIEIHDRSKDLIKSGGEWISSIALENALMGHPAVAEAAVIRVNHAKWSERPLAVVALKPEAIASPEELRAYLATRFPNFWLPDAFEFIDAIPRTSAGKFQKSVLRERYRHYRLRG